VITIDIDDCPMAEIPLTEIFDLGASLLLNDYHNFVRGYVVQELEDTTWLTDVTTPVLHDAGFGMYYSRDRGIVPSQLSELCFSTGSP
jgi:CheY-specific phosphatase CheX